MTDQKILEVNDLEKHFKQHGGFMNWIFGREPDQIKAVDGVDLTLYKNETIGVIGESGCGKTTLLMTLMGLHDKTGGEMIFDGKPISDFDKSDWKDYRSRVQVIFQDPFNSIDPKQTVRDALMEPLKIHSIENKRKKVYEVLERVELRPEDYLSRYPDQLSGGELQRVSIACAIVLEPDILLADEPVSMLDVSTQAANLNLLSDLVNNLDMSMIYISHDLSTVSYVCDTVNVMYLGRVVERAKTEKIINDPKHPYTQELINAIPVPDPDHNRTRTEMEGSPRDPINIGEGCRFRDRCPEKMDICTKTPDFRPAEDSNEHMVSCHLYYDHNLVGKEIEQGANRGGD